MVIRGSLEPARLRALCERARLALEDLEVGAVTCDVRGLTPDAVAVDALARLQVLARRHGRELKLRGAGAELRALIKLMGLGEALPAGD